LTISTEQTAVVSEPVTPVSSPRRRRRLILAACAVLVFGLGFLVPRLVPDPYTRTLLVSGLTLGIVALAVAVLMDQVGLVSFGIGAFYGLSAYSFAVAVTTWHWSPTAAAVFALVVTVAAAGLIGALIVRLHVIAFLMVTLAISQMFYQIVQLSSLRRYLGGDDGIQLTFTGSFLGRTPAELVDPAGFWPIVWVATCGVLLLVFAVRASRYGSLLRGIRENEERLRYCGFNTYWPRVSAFMISGGMAAVAGLLHALYRGFVTPDILTFQFAGNSLIAALVGGIGTLLGPVFGGLLFVWGQSSLSTSGNLPLFMGIAMAIIVIFLPNGAGGAVRTLAGRVRRRIFAGRDRTGA
jgi:branched-chain amino acid transport system permease protein